MLEARGYSRERIPLLTRAWIRDVLQHPREKDGSLRLPAPPPPPLARAELANLLRSRGVPEHLIAGQVQAMLAKARPPRARGKRGRK